MSDERRATPPPPPPPPNWRDFLLLLADGFGKLAKDLELEAKRQREEQSK